MSQHFVFSTGWTLDNYGKDLPPLISGMNFRNIENYCSCVAFCSSK